MTGRRSALSADRAEKLIAEVDETDRQDARTAIAGGVQSAQERWIGGHLIAEALVLELIELVRHSRSSAEVAAYLRAVAQTLDRVDDVH